jgi:hypothetical protein
LRKIPDIDTVEVPWLRLHTEPLHDYELDEHIDQAKGRYRVWVEFMAWFLVGMLLMGILFLLFIALYMIRG